MTASEFISSYEAFKLETIKSVQIINNIEGDGEKYYKIRLTEDDIKLNFNLEEWSKEDFLYQITEVGMMYAEVFIHKGYKSSFVSLDEFIYYTNIIESGKSFNKETFQPYSLKRLELNKDEFMNYQKLYWNDHFMNENGDLVYLNYNHFKQGFVYLDIPSSKRVACEIQDNYWSFTWNPYT